MGAGIGKQIGKHLMQAGLIPRDNDRLVGNVQRPPVVGAGDVRIADGVDDQPGQVDRFTLQRASGVQAGEQKHVLHQLRHPLGFGLHAAHRMGDVVGQVIPFPLGQFGIPANRGQRCAEFVAGVGDELAHPGFAGMPGGQRAGDPVQHPVQCGAELADFGVGAGGINRDDRCGQPHLAAVEFEVGDLAGSRGNP